MCCVFKPLLCLYFCQYKNSRFKESFLSDKRKKRFLVTLLCGNLIPNPSICRPGRRSWLSAAPGTSSNNLLENTMVENWCCHRWPWISRALTRRQILSVFPVVGPLLKAREGAPSEEFDRSMDSSTMCLKVSPAPGSLVSLCVWRALTLLLHGDWGFSLWCRTSACILSLMAIVLLTMVSGYLHVAVQEDMIIKLICGYPN